MSNTPPILLHSLAAISLLLACTGPLSAQKNQVEEEKKPWWDAPQPRFSKSELGGVFSGTVDMRGDAKVSHRTIYKAIAVRLGKGGQNGTVLFDTEMMRMACAIPSKPVMFNTYRDGLGGAGHWVGSPYLFTAESGPSWADEGGNFEDLREGKKAGPLPRSWAQYRGLYRHGEQVVFSYRINGVDILDMPWIEEVGGLKVFTRTLEINPSDLSLVLKICQARDDTEAPTVVVPQGKPDPSFALAKEDGEWHLGIKARKSKVRIKMILTSAATNQSQKIVAAASAIPPAEDLSRFLKGGPPRHPAPLVTKGALSEEKGPYVVDTITPPFDNPDKILFRFGGHDFFSNGDIAVCSIDGDVWRVSGIDSKLDKISWRRLATGLFQPLGLKVVKDKVHVLGRDQITRLHDTNEDGEADFYECFNNGCRIGKHVHEYATGLETDPEGNFYYVKGHGANNEHAGTLLKVSADGADISVVATGFRWPNGSGAGPNGELTVADQQGTWVPSSRVDLVKKGGFYGFMNAHHRKEAPTSYDGPLCWIPHKVDNSCGGQTWNTSDKWGPFKGHMVHCSYGKCTLFLVMQENVGGIDQAGVFQFPFKFQSGGMRARFNPHDGQLYVSGLKGWQTSGAKDGCLQRVRFTGAKVTMPRSLNIHENGIRVGFTQQLDKELAEDLDSWQIEQWNYQWTSKYGSKEYKVSEPSATGHDKVEVRSARLLPGGQEVFLEIPNLAPVMQMKIEFDLETANGDEMIGALHNTIHALSPAL
ncbi:MAG TPA: hypothetical protein DIV39_07270 [Verrucomicrobiales bacterium]|nr:hypothetical protein [Verrucomicrobiales bacterium]